MKNGGAAVGNTPYDLHCPLYREQFASYRQLPAGSSAVARAHELQRTGRFKRRPISQAFRGDQLRAMSLGSFEVLCACGRVFWTTHTAVLGLDGPEITVCPVHTEPRHRGLCAVCDHLRKDEA